MLRFLKRAIASCRIRKQGETAISFRFVQTSVLPQSIEISSNYQFPEQQVEIKTCGKLYEKWRKDKRFSNIPDSDLLFNVRYIDTSKRQSTEPALNNNSPVVLILHGAPGSYNDSTRLTSFLHEHGIRVIAPCFPDFTSYKPGIFRHSACEKTQFLKDFLEAINVSYLDLLICHSSAVYPGLNLCVENIRPRVSGIALFNPGTFHKNMRAVRPYPLLVAMVKLCEHPLGLKIGEMIGPSVLSLSSSPVRLDDCLSPLLSATVMVYGGISESRQQFYELAYRKFPIFMAFSEDDKLIDKELSYKVAYALGVQDPEIFHYDEHGILDKKGRIVNNMKIMAFEKGSHFVFSKHFKTINEEVLNFLQNQIL